MVRADRRLWLLLVGALCLVAGCGGANASPASIAPVRDIPVAQSSDTREVAPSVSKPVPTDTAHSWTMPDLRGKNLRAAQDAIQALTGSRVWYTSTIDLTGRGRHQVRDRNWQVCSSTPAPGDSFTAKARINLGVVRVGSESCP